MSDSDSWLTDSQSCLTDSQLVIIINVFLLIQFHNMMICTPLFYHWRFWLTCGWRLWLIHWLIDCLWAGLSVSASQVTPDFWHPLGVCHCQLCADLIYWLTLENEHWLRLRLANEAHHFLFWLNEGIWFCLVNDNKLTKMNPLSLWWFNEACVPISPQTECTLSLLSINAILAQKPHNIYIKRTIFHLTEWLDYYWINETNILTLVFKFNRSSNQTFFFYLTLRETLT